MAIWTIIEKDEKNIIILNIAPKFHKVVIKISGLRHQTMSKMVFFHVQRAITPEGMVCY